MNCNREQTIDEFIKGYVEHYKELEAEMRAEEEEERKRERERKKKETINDFYQPNYYPDFKLCPPGMILNPPYDHPKCGSDATLLITNNGYLPMVFTIVLIKDPSFDIELSYSCGILQGRQHFPIKINLKADFAPRTADMFYVKVIASYNTKIEDDNWFKNPHPSEKIMTKKVEVRLAGVFSDFERLNRNQYVRDKIKEDEEEDLYIEQQQIQYAEEAEKFRNFKQILDDEYLQNQKNKELRIDYVVQPSFNEPLDTDNTDICGDETDICDIVQKLDIKYSKSDQSKVMPESSDTMYYSLDESMRNKYCKNHVNEMLDKSLESVALGDMNCLESTTIPKLDSEFEKIESTSEKSTNTYDTILAGNLATVEIKPLYHKNVHVKHEKERKDDVKLFNDKKCANKSSFMNVDSFIASSVIDGTIKNNLASKCYQNVKSSEICNHGSIQSVNIDRETTSIDMKCSDLGLNRSENDYNDYDASIYRTMRETTNEVEKEKLFQKWVNNKPPNMRYLCGSDDITLNETITNHACSTTNSPRSYSGTPTKYILDLLNSKEYQYKSREDILKEMIKEESKVK